MNPRPTMTRPDAGGFEEVGGMSGQMPMAPPDSGAVAVYMQNNVIAAQKVAVPRNHKRILDAIKTLAVAAGRDKYLYSWQVNNRRAGTKDDIEGPTIKCALDVARTYGNCSVDVRVVNEGSHLVFYARFSDYETGFQLTRAYRQRLNQDLGMKDADRAADLVFQVGQSKAIRNVITNALSTFIDYAVEEASSGLLKWCEANMERAVENLQKVATKLDVPMKLIQDSYGRPLDKFTAANLASCLTRLKGIEEGSTSIEDAFGILDATEPKPTKEKTPEEEKQPKPPSRTEEQKPAETVKSTVDAERAETPESTSTGEQAEADKSAAVTQQPRRDESTISAKAKPVQAESSTPSKEPPPPKAAKAPPPPPKPKPAIDDPFGGME